MRDKAYFHLPGLFEFYELYRMFLPLYREHREYFYDCVKLVPYMVLRQTVSGVEAGLASERMTRRRFLN